jgi:acyl-CoA thioesterase-1
MKSYLFVYGTLLDEKIRHAVLGRPALLSPGKIKGFSMSSLTIDGTAYPALVEDPSSNETIEGGYFEITDQELEKTDTYETSAYKRKQVVFDNGVRVWVYCTPPVTR